MADQTHYCVKCKEKREMKNPVSVTMKNGKPAMKGVCAICGTTMFALVSAKKPSTHSVRISLWKGSRCVSTPALFSHIQVLR